MNTYISNINRIVSCLLGTNVLILLFSQNVCGQANQFGGFPNSGFGSGFNTSPSGTGFSGGMSPNTGSSYNIFPANGGLPERVVPTGGNGLNTSPTSKGTSIPLLPVLVK